ncbi:MAG: hypothetical protein EPO20_01045 [Betaproteobacteria bacterium]|nr:MAG: hypothetical protein EPO20_01045 [Betaproteobacteria bacterium]
MSSYLKDLGSALARVFAFPSYLALAGLMALGAFLLAVWFPNLGLIAEVFAGSQAPLTAKLGIAVSLLGGIGTNFSPLAAAYTLAIAVLFGTSTAMIVYLLKQRRPASAGRNAVIGSGGVASGALGIGCAACGSVILGAATPFAGALAALPLAGGEFGIASVVLLSASLLLVGRSIARAAACPL